ncbi:unnamed protein product [Owenia fusiformis]|uniref:Ankyrin repeat and SOCS box protein 17 n=1 Tax=Owenia fusiformis TaxID=6347 RepID=A0A8J1U5L5_OWEFU|nr:unnamed protein product [Owenia fusiformis]
MTTSKNIFTILQTKYGQGAFLNDEHAFKCRDSLVSLVRDHGNYRGVAERIAKDGLSFFTSTKDVASKENVLFMAAHVCFKYNVDNTPLVRSLVATSIVEQGNVAMWFNNQNLILLGDIPESQHQRNVLYDSSLQQTKSQRRSNNLDILNYILYHASDVPVKRYKRRRHFELVAFVDAPVKVVFSEHLTTPLLIACRKVHSDMVLLLLRHGADPLRTFGEHQHLFPKCPLENIIIQMNGMGLVFDFNNAHPSMRFLQQSNPIRVRRESSRERNLLRCLAYFCRVMPTLPITNSKALENILNPAPMIGVKSTNSSDDRMWVHQSFYERVSPYRTHNPPELLHLARVVIRNAIKTAWHPLHTSVFQLPLPRILMNYLDLQDD